MADDPGVAAIAAVMSDLCELRRCTPSAHVEDASRCVAAADAARAEAGWVPPWMEPVHRYRTEVDEVGETSVLMQCQCWLCPEHRGVDTFRTAI